MKPLKTPRLTLRQLAAADAPFILELLNDPDWLRFIGDRQVHDTAGAAAYIAGVPAALQAQHGFSLWRVGLKTDDTPVGLCGLIKRDSLPEVDLGFAFLPKFRGRGYALEAAAACLERGASAHGLRRILAITVPENAASIRLLEKLGMKHERDMVDPKDGAALRVYAWTAPRRA